jgi:Flp pilus assembly protein TadG
MKGNLLGMLRDESGQIIPWMALMITLILGAAGLVIDLGHAYVCYRQLQSTTDAAALAGAYAMTISGATNATVTAEVNAFSSIQSPSVGANATGNLQSPAVQTSFKCVTDAPQYTTVPCTAAVGSGGALVNVIQVTQQASAPTYFIRALTFWKKTPVTSLRLSAVSTAAMESGPPIQVNVAMVIDTTASMGQTDTDPNCDKARITCALAGVQTLLQGLTPCAAGFTSSKCTPYDSVSLFTFPAVETSQIGNDTNCKGNTPQIESYTTPAAGTSWSTLSTATTTYQITPYQSNYSSTNGEGGAFPSTSSSALIAATTTNQRGCGMQTPGGAGTYYAGVIYAAQSSLAAQAAANPNSQNVMVILSDGDASSGSGGNNCGLPGGYCMLNSSGQPATNNGSTYPSLQDQCAQAVAAAQYASSQGTTVYTIAYGAPTSGCSTDQKSKTNPTGTNITPCQAMQEMASDASDFYSDATASGGGETAGACPGSGDLEDIFTSLRSRFSHARLVPNTIS